MVKIKELKGKCEMCHKVKATGLIRGRQVCAKCFDILNRDNYKRVEVGKPIPSKFDLIITV